MDAHREVIEPQDQVAGDVKITAPDIDPPDDGGDDGGDSGDGGGQGGDTTETRQASDATRRAPGSVRSGNRRNWKASNEIKEQLTRATQVIQDMRAAHDRDIADIRQRLTQGPQSAAPATSAPSASEQQLQTIYAAQAAEMKAFRAHDPRNGEYDLSKYNQLSRQARSLENRIDMDNYFRERGVDPNSRAAAQRPQDPAMIARDVHLRTIADTVKAEHPWLQEGGDRGRRARAAIGRAVEYLLEMGRPNTIETHREAAVRLERDLGITPRRPAPSPAQERRYTAVGDNNRGAPYDASPREVSVPAEMLQGTGLPMDKIRRAVFRRS